jgi:hypothetical protein
LHGRGKLLAGTTTIKPAIQSPVVSRERAGHAPQRQKESGPATPNRPAIAFLVTPKLPLGGRSGKLMTRTRSSMIGCSSNKTWRFKVKSILTHYFEIRYRLSFTVRIHWIFPNIREGCPAAGWREKQTATRRCNRP